MRGRKKKSKKLEVPARTTWVYDEEFGWIDINLFLSKIKKIEEEINSRCKKTG
ncbi:MAG: hypothetical protein HPY89_01485 [Pelotomaculum sp.]|nr:hypothetical protein [Pelotomaculum sp.]